MAHLLALIRGLGLILLAASGTLGLLVRHSPALLLLLLLLLLLSVGGRGVSKLCPVRCADWVVHEVGVGDVKQRFQDPRELLQGDLVLSIVNDESEDVERPRQAAPRRGGEGFHDLVPVLHLKVSRNRKVRTDARLNPAQDLLYLLHRDHPAWESKQNHRIRTGEREDAKAKAKAKSVS